MTTRSSAIIIVAMSGALALGACGSDATKTGTAATGTAASDCPTGTLKAEGSSAQKNAIEAAIKSFQTKCSGTTVNYAATGSGAGIKQFIAGQVDFGGSDSTLKDDEAASAATTCASPAWHLPMVTGPVGIAYNLPSVSSLVLNADVTAKIFLGQI
ncbi:MAG TPA: substrate-binding domain-containing protein, partial [Dermatophilaceae bacterium]|nr:substrate-binding domain-containing protein [Dermatophilaceae bacterium]